jgi:hypothetical protein
MEALSYRYDEEFGIIIDTFAFNVSRAVKVF